MDASTELEELHSGLGGAGSQKFGQWCGQFVIYDVSSPGTVDAKQGVGAFHVDAEECIEDGRDQDGAAEVGITDVLMDVIRVRRSSER